MCTWISNFLDKPCLLEVSYSFKEFLNIANPLHYCWTSFFSNECPCFSQRQSLLIFVDIEIKVSICFLATALLFLKIFNRFILAPLLYKYFILLFGPIFTNKNLSDNYMWLHTGKMVHVYFKRDSHKTQVCLIPEEQWFTLCSYYEGGSCAELYCACITVLKLIFKFIVYFLKCFVSKTDIAVLSIYCAVFV